MTGNSGAVAEGSEERPMRPPMAGKEAFLGACPTGHTGRQELALIFRYALKMVTHSLSEDHPWVVAWVAR